MAMSYKNMFVLLNFLTLLNILLASNNYSLAKAITKDDDDNGITIDLFHRDSHLSPSYNPSTTHFERLRSSFNRSFARKHSLWSKKSRTRPSSIAAPLTSINGEYLMKIRMGTPPMDILGIADTGSDLTWTQCKPCNNCFKQRAPFFDPKKSKTYKRVSCKSKQCDRAVSLGCDSTSGCKYRVSYGDKSYSNGDLSRETFTFGSKNAAFPKVVFGCGHEDGGIFDPSATGIVGLGGGSLSIVNQLKKFVQRKFSYCLTSLDSNFSNKISFGAKALARGPKAVSTPLIKKMPDTFYFITLRGISIGGKKLEYYAEPADTPRLGDGNMIIDSGTTLTFLPTELYEKVESTLAGAVKGSKRVSASQGSFNLCYELPESDGVFGDALPRIVVHFAGADLELSQKSVFVEVEPGVVCLTFLPSENLAILGNLHQMNYHVGYDLVNMKLSFEPMDCSKFK